MELNRKTASEKNFQESFVNEMMKYKWEAPDFLNGNIHRVTVATLINHWRQELNRINADQLEGFPLTDGEFSQVMGKVSQISNSFEAAKLLAIEESKGKIDGIYRDDNPRLTRKQITLTIFKKAEVRGGDSSYKIAREVQTDNGSRFDIILLINGLPLINIEQKRADKPIEEAFYQFKRYYEDGEFSNNFMAFSQMMVITSEIATRYFATPKSLSDFSLSFVFTWADRQNRPVNDWRRVIELFLMIPMAHQMVGDYVIIDEARDEENRRHMIMRPYQVYALQAIEGAAFGWNNDGVPHGGYVWHTTGSGKTVTSFKTALFLATRAGFDKVVFMVDRRELDAKTSENFKAYAAYEPVTVDDTKHTYQLAKSMMSPRTGIIVTTTFKLHNLVKDLVENGDYSLAEKKIVFIIDEAHRTTMGDMMVAIKDYFRKNGLFYGFTGTPLFDESQAVGRINEKSEVINTTEKLFGPLLHQYTIDEAIADGNVLGFHVDYVNTGEFISYDDLRDQLMAKMLNEKPELGELEIERIVSAYSEAEVEEKAFSEGLFEYQDETHIPRVVERILNNWDSQSQGRQFNAILTVAYRNRVLAYYKEFKKQLAEREMNLNVAMTFSFGDANNPDRVPPEKIQDMFKDYASFTGIEFYAGDKTFGEDAYFGDLVDRSTRGGSGRNPKNIDLIIVAQQLLTGYDSKYLNTLYVDRSLELHGLIQAYSRTNRIFGKTKEFGTIINFQFPRLTEKAVNEALRLYGSGGKNSRVIVDKYPDAVAKFAQKIEDVILALTNPTEWESLLKDEEKCTYFMLSFRDAAEQMNIVRQYYEYEWNELTFGLSEHTWLQYTGAYKNIKKKIEPGPDDDPVINPLPGKTRLAATQIIDAAHILELIGNKVKPEDGVQTVDGETLRIIYEQIQELSDMGDHETALLLREFVDAELMAGNVSSEIPFDEAYEAWKSKRLSALIDEYAEQWGLDTELLKKTIEAYSPRKPDYVPYIEELIETVDYENAKKASLGSRLRLNMELIGSLPMFVGEVKEKYGD
ncbi:MAG TPA: type I restriction endonuclease subunit R [Clostridiaceae bacterium]|nr:type I restriction endonuclease subunit R [Clostridiaceae bacterium]